MNTIAEIALCGFQAALGVGALSIIINSANSVVKDSAVKDKHSVFNTTIEYDIFKIDTKVYDLSAKVNNLEKKYEELKTELDEKCLKID